MTRVMRFQAEKPAADTQATACMGGWCRSRESCHLYLVEGPDRDRAVDRLCGEQERPLVHIAVRLDPSSAHANPGAPA